MALRAFNEPRSLAADIDEYVEAGGDDRDRLSAALSHLRRIGADGLQAVGAGARLMGRETLSAHPEDISTIDDFLTDALSKLGSDATKKEKAAVSTMVSRLCSFSDWLQREGRPCIMNRIGGNTAQQSSLTADYTAFSKATKRTAPLDPFRKYLGLEPQQGFRPYDDDARLIEGLANEELSKLDPSSQHRRKTIQGTASAQRKFSGWLRTEGRESIASRINGNNKQQRSLDADYRAYREAKGKSGVTLKKLRQYVQVLEANRALGVPAPQQRAGSDSTSIPTWMRDLPTPPSESEWPPIVGAFGQAGLQEAAGSSSTWSPQLPTYFDFPTPKGEPARSSDIYRGLGSLVDLPSTPQEVRDDAQSGPVQSHAGRPPFFIGPSGVPQELEDIGCLVGEDWQHGSQPVPDFLLDVLDNKMLLPSSRMAPQPVSINGATYSITLGPRGRRDAQLIHHAGPSSAPKARVGGSAASASAGDRSGRVLGARDWLGDEHIQRDYELLAQELWASNPNLAARTRFVDPLMAFRVGQGTNADALSAFHQIVDDPNGNDTADFLFLPVNDASTMGPDDGGSHWSCCWWTAAIATIQSPTTTTPPGDAMTDPQQCSQRRWEPKTTCKTPNTPAEERLRLCVFVLDGTRALARRLAGRRQPDLNLSNLVVDRQALQNRLRG
ncbi:hypothetical protein [Bradyrhizobium niftali]|uniref:hypothetical protein n=1 Tax=Bradyrhizobium niftali TaxID=2560055 RepID=UPI001F294B2D|nr:hypothetical protein [Bradyrhizobium niftali]